MGRRRAGGAAAWLWWFCACCFVRRCDTVVKYYVGIHIQFWREETIRARPVSPRNDLGPFLLSECEEKGQRCQRMTQHSLANIALPGIRLLSTFCQRSVWRGNFVPQPDSWLEGPASRLQHHLFSSKASSQQLKAQQSLTTGCSDTPLTPVD